MGTDDLGIQGEAIIMKEEDFAQGMSHEDALMKGTLRSDLPKVIRSEILNKIDKQTASFPSRPDWDGYLTLKEANDWYRNGNGQPLYVDASKIDLYPVKIKDFNGVGSSIFKNFLSVRGNKDTGLVYGTIKMTLLNYSFGNVILGRKNDGYLDTYDFNQDGRFFRDAATKIGNIYAGNGIPYKIYNYGVGTIKK